MEAMDYEKFPWCRRTETKRQGGDGMKGRTIHFYPVKWSKKSTPVEMREYVCELSSACGCQDEIVDWAKDNKFFTGKLVFHDLEGTTKEVLI